MKTTWKPIIILLFAALCWLPHRARAVEVSSMMAAAPQAAALAQTWSPHAANALGSFGMGIVETGTAFIDIFRLPLGILECSLGAPFGYWDNGIYNLGKGCVAPFKFVGQILLLPVRLISLGVVN